MTTTRVWTAAQHARARWVLAAAAVIAALAHLPVIGHHLEEAPYMGVLFIVLTAACVSLAAVATVRDAPVVYALAILTCGLAILGYAATRIVAFPELGDDVGDWLEPLGVLSVLAEAVVVAAAVTGLRHPPCRHRPRPRRRPLGT